MGRKEKLTRLFCFFFRYYRPRFWSTFFVITRQRKVCRETWIVGGRWPGSETGGEEQTKEKSKKNKHWTEFMRKKSRQLKRMERKRKIHGRKRWWFPHKKIKKKILVRLTFLIFHLPRIAPFSRPVRLLHGNKPAGIQTPVRPLFWERSIPRARNRALNSSQ